jgi:hypothetical protein
MLEFSASVGFIHEEHTLCSVTFCPENRAVHDVWKNIVQYSQTGHMGQYNTAHALCTLDN